MKFYRKINLKTVCPSHTQLEKSAPPPPLLPQYLKVKSFFNWFDGINSLSKINYLNYKIDILTITREGTTNDRSNGRSSW